MKKISALMACLAVVALVALILAPVTAVAASTSGSWNGWITDEACGAKGANAAHKDCAMKCIAKGGKLVLYNTGDKQIYSLDNQSLAKEHIGHEVTVTGSVDGKAITVSAIAPAAAKGM
jgi:hypothetical protein